MGGWYEVDGLAYGAYWTSDAFKASKTPRFCKKRAELHEIEDVTTRNSRGPSGCKIRFHNTYDGSMNCKNAQEHGKSTET